MSSKIPSISADATRAALQGDVPAAEQARTAGSRAERDAQELHGLEQQLYYPDRSAPVTAGPDAGPLDRLRRLLRRPGT